MSKAASLLLSEEKTAVAGAGADGSREAELLAAGDKKHAGQGWRGREGGRGAGWLSFLPHLSLIPPALQVKTTESLLLQETLR